MSEFTTRDITWRTLAQATPEPGVRCLVRVSGDQVAWEGLHYVAPHLWSFESGGSVRACLDDLWRPEDER